MKKSKIIIPALAMLVMSTAATVTGTVAWFSMNKTVTAEGMKIKAKGQGSIVISKYDGTDSAHKGSPMTNTKTTGVNFADASSHQLYPSTHSTDYTNHATGLKYVTNGDKINPESGTAINDSVTLTYGVANGSTYFSDYDMYIAGDGQEFTGQDIKINLFEVTTANINKAVSIDFYYTVYEVNTGGYASVGSANYVGQLSVAGKVNTSESVSTAQTELKIQNIKIPQSGAGAVAIKMRAYYDGALVDNSVSGKPWTTLKACGAGSNAAQFPNAVYFYNNLGQVMMENDKSASTDTSALYYVDLDNSTTTFARSADYLQLDDVALGVTFTADEHPTTPNP